MPLLWKVSDADNAVYLLGSFHLLKPDDYPLSTDVNAAFADAPKRGLRTAAGRDEFAAARPADDAGRACAPMAPGSTANCRPATVEKLKAWQAANSAGLQNAGLSPERMQMFEPWFVGLIISLTDMGKQGFDPKLGLDQHFIDAAAHAGKPTGGFETGAQQIALSTA